MKRALFTSARTGTGNDHWCTPPVILDRVRQVGPIGLDPCSNAQSIVGARLSFTEKGNGLAKPWTVRTGEVAYVNPPYSALREWCTKCVGEGAAIIVEHGHLILLIPARTDTVAWHTAAPNNERFREMFGPLGRVLAPGGAR